MTRAPESEEARLWLWAGAFAVKGVIDHGCDARAAAMALRRMGLVDIVADADLTEGAPPRNMIPIVTERAAEILDAVAN